MMISLINICILRFYIGYVNEKSGGSLDTWITKLITKVKRPKFFLLIFGNLYLHIPISKRNFILTSLLSQKSI